MRSGLTEERPYTEICKLKEVTQMSDEKVENHYIWTISAKDQACYDHINDPEPYRMSGDSLPLDGIPQGIVARGFLADSSVYPGVGHEYRVYVPNQYDGSEPAALIVFLDGLSYLNETSCNIIQGYIFSMPLEVREFELWLDKLENGQPVVHHPNS